MTARFDLAVPRVVVDEPRSQNVLDSSVDGGCAL